MKVILKFLYAIGNLFENMDINEEISKLADNLLTSLISYRIKESNEKDMKEIDKLTLKGFFNVIKNLLETCLKCLKKDYRSEIENYLIIGQIKSDNLTRKIQGISIFIENHNIINIRIFLINYYRIVSENQYKIKNPENELIKSALNSVKEIKLISIIFNDFPHPELIKKSYEIIRFLTICDQFTNSDAELIISCYKKQHEEVKIPILNLIVDMAEYSSYPILQILFNEIHNSISLINYSEGYMSFLTLYTLNILKNIQRRKEEAKKIIKNLEKSVKPPQKVNPPKELFDENYKLYDIDALWNIAVYSNSENKIDIKLKDFAIGCLAKILNDQEELTKNYLIKALDAIKSNSEISIRCMKFITTFYRLFKENKRNLKQFIKKAFNLETHFLDVVFQNFVKYKENSNKSNSLIPAKNPMTHVFFYSSKKRNFYHVGNTKKFCVDILIL